MVHAVLSSCGSDQCPAKESMPPSDQKPQPLLIGSQSHLVPRWRRPTNHPTGIDAPGQPSQGRPGCSDGRLRPVRRGQSSSTPWPIEGRLTRRCPSHSPRHAEAAPRGCQCRMASAAAGMPNLFAGPADSKSRHLGPLRSGSLFDEAVEPHHFARYPFSGLQILPSFFPLTTASTVVIGVRKAATPVAIREPLDHSRWSAFEEEKENSTSLPLRLLLQTNSQAFNSN
ncbi:hypothetical protein N7510_010239 [Penicillium lagena]|uniref:uncharacterized protein n=1 Tax=Penicillium lagena TaxID=94218 RepID=UPI00253F92FB|nr:uncharacterized protein N7510_010239 [Penicillium lagena]KAJ5605085.1 hypothetical protein N7510_010239 [Penicillium lagena]